MIAVWTVVVVAVLAVAAGGQLAPWAAIVVCAAFLHLQLRDRRGDRS